MPTRNRPTTQVDPATITKIVISRGSSGLAFTMNVAEAGDRDMATIALGDSSLTGAQRSTLRALLVALVNDAASAKGYA